MIPLYEIYGLVIALEVLPEHISMRRHFIDECGWSDAEFQRLRSVAWFCAKVSAWKDGEELAAAYLGCSCYRTVEEFYTTYAGDYLADMTREVVRAALTAGSASDGAATAELVPPRGNVVAPVRIVVGVQGGVIQGMTADSPVEYVHTTMTMATVRPANCPRSMAAP